MNLTPEEKREKWRQIRDTQEREFGNSSRAKTARVDLGLALLEVFRAPGETLSLRDIAAWCGCTDAGIYMIQVSAMKKLRNRLRFGRAAELGREISR